MKIKSFGCSFLFGSELPDHNRQLPFSNPSKFTWPWLISQQLNCEYDCYAKPGAGNLQIMEQILIQASQSTSDDLFVIGWTWIDRFDHYDANFDMTKLNEPHWYQSPWHTIMPNSQDQLANFYYKHLHSEYQDKLLNLTYIKLVIDLLTSKNIKFIMTYMDHLLFEEKWHNSLAVADLQKSVSPCMITFEGLNFLEWSRKNNYAISKNLHPLEQAHAEAADYILPFLIDKIQSA